MSNQQQISDPTFGLTNVELADYYDQTGSADFDGGEVVTVDNSRPTRGVSISVRFSDDELALLRDRANADGVKVTAWIRQAALEQSGPTLDRDAILDYLNQYERQHDEVVRHLRVWATSTTQIGSRSRQPQDSK